MVKDKKKSKRIGIDARFYGPANKGLGRYTKEVVDGVTGSDRDNEYVVFLRRENFDEFDTANPRVKKVLADIRWYTLAEQLLFPFIIWRERVDFMHFAHFNVPLFAPVKFIVTIHDLILTEHPTKRASTLAPFFYWLKNAAYRLIIRTAVWRSRKIIAVSDYTRQEIINKFKPNPAKVITIYEGVAEALKSPSGTDDKKVILRYNIHEPYLLYVGNAYPHKNLENLIESFTIIKEKLTDYSLVLVGKEDYFYKRLVTLAEKSKYRNNIIFPGYVPDMDLAAIYRQARTYIFPSFYEGFGLPPLEAMQHGCITVCSNKTCLPEILGEASLYFDPLDKSEMISAIIKASTDITLRAKLKKESAVQITKYNWRKCARETIEIYRQIS